ncbi:hypothetical protein BBD42_27565 [Paenibacillus sp. BIHB 4019]|uniref:Uncharacterized protein n=1 Tax=Paenibacillus sp. BIHB 4019 TaxID=1870819 RepID=A0A1B2DQ61_9BACL|nr:hypothetical protein BBD42_27565 [Paenibacillus sp. BIHB 4019]
MKKIPSSYFIFKNIALINSWFIGLKTLYHSRLALQAIFLDFLPEFHIILIVEYMGVRFCVTLENKFTDRPAAEVLVRL